VPVVLFCFVPLAILFVGLFASTRNPQEPPYPRNPPRVKHLLRARGEEKVGEVKTVSPLNTDRSRTDRSSTARSTIRSSTTTTRQPETSPRECRHERNRPYGGAAHVRADFRRVSGDAVAAEHVPQHEAVLGAGEHADWRVVRVFRGRHQRDRVHFASVCVYVGGDRG
jgi:hypothetical protein